MKRKKYTVNTIQCLTGAATAIFFIAAAAYNTVLSRYLVSSIFLLFGIIFLIASVMNGMNLSITECEIQQSLLGRKIRVYKKSEIREIGVVGLKLFGKSRNCGVKYIYISKEKMTENERFQMCLKWPPRDKMYMTWDATRLSDIQMFWNGKIETYNTGDLMF